MPMFEVHPPIEERRAPSVNVHERPADGVPNPTQGAVHGSATPRRVSHPTTVLLHSLRAHASSRPQLLEVGWGAGRQHQARTTLDVHHGGPRRRHRCAGHRMPSSRDPVSQHAISSSRVRVMPVVHLRHLADPASKLGDLSGRGERERLPVHRVVCRDVGARHAHRTHRRPGAGRSDLPCTEGRGGRALRRWRMGAGSEEHDRCGAGEKNVNHGDLVTAGACGMRASSFGPSHARRPSPGSRSPWAAPRPCP
jgi:hypothetical protein